MGIAASAEAASFQGLGFLPGDDSSGAGGVSPDGSTVVGSSGTAGVFSGREAFIWDATNGMVGLGVLPGDPASGAFGVSADGSMVAGNSQGSGGVRAFIWDSTNGMVDLGSLGGTLTLVSGISADGSTVVGFGDSGITFQAFIWDATGGMVALGTLPGGVDHSRAYDVSPDGSRVVGYGEIGTGGEIEAFIWDATNGMVGIGDLPGGNLSSIAFGMSADGATIVGFSEGASGTEAFIWNSTNGMVGLGVLPGGGVGSWAQDVSADGSTVVGVSDSGSGCNIGEAWAGTYGGCDHFIWDATNGMRPLDDVLTSLGADLTGWTLTGEVSISDDGNTLVGSGTNPLGQTEAWRAVLQPETPPVCVPVAAGVPGNPGPPEWWGPSGDPDDPRWRGAFSLGHIADHARLRALRRTVGSQDYLYLSWDVAVDPGGAVDYLNVGFYDPTTSNGNAFRFDLNTGSPVAAGSSSDGAFSVQGYYRDAITPSWSPLGSVPTWLTDTARSWVRCPGSGCNWTVQMRVPIGSPDPASNPASGLPISDEFRFWHHLEVFGAVAIATNHSWPEAATTPLASNPDPLEWEPVRAGSSAPCRRGISIAPSQITTDNPVPHQIDDSNVFHARPLNETGTALAGDDVDARFRIANWGSVLFDSPEWREFDSSCSVASGVPSTSVADGSQFDLTCSWNLSAADLCQYDPNCPSGGVYNRHQCVLVELSSGAGAASPLVFSRASAYRNMDVVTASEFSREAAVSIRGLPPLEGQSERDVYLYVQTRNLPSADEAGDDPLSAELDPKLARRMATGVASFSDVEKSLPTYLVHVFHDTGATLEQAGTSFVHVRAQPSFGYFLHHEGELNGWRHQLEGTGMTEVAPNLYRLSVPNDGVAIVRSTIEAVEPRSLVELIQQYWWILLLLLLILVIALMRRAA